MADKAAGRSREISQKLVDGSAATRRATASCAAMTDAPSNAQASASSSARLRARGLWQAQITY